METAPATWSKSGPAGTRATKPDPLEVAIPPEASILVDSSVVLAYLTGTEPTSLLATQLFDAFIATGRNLASLSVITVGEILVRPFRAGPQAVARAEGFLRHFGDIRVVDIDYDTAREAARIRAESNLRTPDALILASALASEVDVLVTNDRAWTTRLPSMAPAHKVCLLSDL